jgi:hypothetical protein
LVIDASRSWFFSDATWPFNALQIHKARNIMDRLPKSMHAQVRRVLRQAWELDDAGKAETLLRNLARHLEKDWEGVSNGCWGAVSAKRERRPIEELRHGVDLVIMAAV